MQRKTVTILVGIIAIASAVATLSGIFSTDGSGVWEYESIRGKSVQIYGRGIYQHMSADVAVQGIAQDYVTLFVALPLLIVSLIGYWKKSLRSHFLLAGTVAYFFVTYLFYTAMGMYNALFLVYVLLLACSFFALLLSIGVLEPRKTASCFSAQTPSGWVGGFLIFNSLAIALLWLSVVVPPLLDGSIYPDSLDHYTTLIVQGFDLGLLLPLAFVSGLLLIDKKPLGYLFGTVYFVFLALLMTALTAKIIAMAINGVNVIPVIFIIPMMNAISVVCLWSLMKNIHGQTPERTELFSS
ncbi:hypothetical protein JW992_03515 [candidate division KSB1 bacterium]|nr:hypothetical protein [candidate division KSB1 bacterium]